MIYGYIRISTDRQTLENQEFEIKNFAQNQNLQIDRWVKETISGTKDFEKRAGTPYPQAEKVRHSDLLRNIPLR